MKNISPKCVFPEAGGPETIILLDLNPLKNRNSSHIDLIFETIPSL